MDLSGAEIAVRTLERLGVEAAFGLPGSFILPLYDALARSRLRLVTARHEQGAALMAEGWAMAKGAPALCLATAGPGATNLVTGLAAAYCDSQPMVVVTGQVPREFRGRGALQEATGLGRTVNQVKLLGQVCKGSRAALSANEIEAALIWAWRLAVSGRPGPVNVEIGVDALNEAAPWQELRVRRPSRPRASLKVLAQAAERLLAAREPAIVAGGGVIDSGAAPALLELAEALCLPVATTLKGKGALPEDHPLSLGCLGLFGHNAANRYLRGSPDLLLVLGASLSEFSTQCWDASLLAAPILRFDLDAAPLPAPFTAALDIPGDLAQNLGRLLRLLPVSRKVNWRGPLPEDRLKRVTSLKAATAHFNEGPAASAALPMRPERLMAELRRALPAELPVFSESVTWTERYLPCLMAGTHRVGTGLAPIGFALPAAIGACAALNRPALAVMGDGGFQLNGLDLLTAAQAGLPVIALVLSNGRYASIHDAQELLFAGRHTGSVLPPLDLTALAASMGLAAFRLERPEDVGPQLARALATRAPTLVEAVVDPEARPPFKPRYLSRTRAWKVPGYADTPTGTRAIVGMLKEA